MDLPMLEWGIIGNVMSDRSLRVNAKVWLCLWTGGSPDRPVVRGISKGGRTITKRIATKRLRHLRAAWIPPKLRDEVGMVWATKEEAQTMADGLTENWITPHLEKPPR